MVDVQSLIEQEVERRVGEALQDAMKHVADAYEAAKMALGDLQSAVNRLAALLVEPAQRNEPAPFEPDGPRAEAEAIAKAHPFRPSPVVGSPVADSVEGAVWDLFDGALTPVFRVDRMTPASLTGRKCLSPRMRQYIERAFSLAVELGGRKNPVRVLSNRDTRLYLAVQYLELVGIFEGRRYKSGKMVRIKQELPAVLPVLVRKGVA